MIVLREALTDADLEAWRRVRLAVLPNERCATVAEIRAQSADESGRLFLLALLDGRVIGSGLSGTSSLGCAGLHPRVVPEERRRGAGTALHEALAAHARACGHAEAVGFVDDPGSLAFALALGYREVDRQVEQVLAVPATAVAPEAQAGVELVSIAERPDLLRAVFPLAQQGYADMAAFRSVSVTLEGWLREEATLAGGSFVALVAGEPVGYSGLCDVPDRPSRAEDGFTVVRRDRRRSGLGATLKRATIAWAAANGIREIVTWTQGRNDAMRTLNERLGYAERSVARTVLRAL